MESWDTTAYTTLFKAFGDKMNNYSWWLIENIEEGQDVNSAQIGGKQRKTYLIS